MERLANSLTKVATRSPKSIVLEAAKLARFSDGACTCTLGDTSVLTTAVCPQETVTNPASFLPMTVSYRQKAAAAGRIPMTHLRRDIGITEKETLTSRIIDRSIRPAFSKALQSEVQIICNLLAVDGSNDPEVLAINGASTSLAISDIPWDGPVGAARVGLIGENVIINPTRQELNNSRLDLIISANSLGNLMMIDGSCKEPVLITDIMKVIKSGIKECKTVIEAISALQKAIGKPKRDLDSSVLPNQEHIDHMMSITQSRIRQVLTNHELDKIGRGIATKTIMDESFIKMKEHFPDISSYILLETFSFVLKTTYRSLLLETGLRCDGRQPNQLRPISCSVDLYKPLHGSALFQRGQTQVLCSTTFDSPDAAFRTDSMTNILSGIKEKNFMLHYEFPPFATNEVGKVATAPNRREIGHGALAEKSIRPLVPEQDMTIRLNCEVLESNGSSSMASVCAGSLSLMDAGVKLKEHVSGVAMGLMGDAEDATSSSNNKTDSKEPVILTDISGLEDYLGDMDFKIAGTRKAVTALQLDVKPVKGVSPNIVYKAIQKAQSARGEIINKMDAVIRKPRDELKSNHPVLKSIYIPPHKISKFVGFNGSNLKKMMANIGVRISSHSGLESDSFANQDSEGTTPCNFMIFAPNTDAMNEAEDYIKSIMEEHKEPELEFNAIYTATIQEIRDNGVMLTLYENMSPTLLHVSQLDTRQVKHPKALNLEVGQQIQVKYFGRDPATGQMRLSRKSLLMSSVPRVSTRTVTEGNPETLTN